MQVTRYTISFFWLLQFGTFIRRHSFFMITIYIIFLPSTLAGFFIAICRVMTNRFRALTSGWMWFIGERRLRSLRDWDPGVQDFQQTPCLAWWHISRHWNNFCECLKNERICHSVLKETFCLTAFPYFCLVLRPFENNFHRTLDVLPCSRTSAWFCLVYHKTNTKQPLQMIKFVHTSHIYFIVGISWLTRIVQISIFRTLWWQWVRFIIPYKIHVVITNTEQARNVSKWVVRKTMSWHVTFS